MVFVFWFIARVVMVVAMLVTRGIMLLQRWLLDHHSFCIHAQTKKSNYCLSPAQLKLLNSTKLNLAKSKNLIIFIFHIFNVDKQRWLGTEAHTHVVNNVHYLPKLL